MSGPYPESYPRLPSGQDDLTKLSDEELFHKVRLANWGAPAFDAYIAEQNRRLLSGEATFRALIKAKDAVLASAPEDHDVLVETFELLIENVTYVPPHAFIFLGFDGDGHQTCAVAHFSQVVTKIIMRPKRGPQRIITGFARA